METFKVLADLLGPAIGTIIGILTSQKLTNMRIDNLAEKVNKHNTLIDRMYKVETRVTVLEDEIKEG